MNPVIKKEIMDCIEEQVLSTSSQLYYSIQEPKNLEGCHRISLLVSDGDQSLWSQVLILTNTKFEVARYSNSLAFQT